LSGGGVWNPSDIAMGKHAANAMEILGVPGINPFDPRMRVQRPKNPDMQQTVDLDVVDKSPLAGSQLNAVNPPDTLIDPLESSLGHDL
jgi:hypothetical protein